MRSLKKNKQPFYYATYDAEKKVYDRDEDGNIKYIEIDGETADGMYVIFNANNEKKEVTLPEGNWNVCINDTLAGTDTIETISGTAEVAPVSALILVKGDGNGSTAVASAGTLPAWMAYVFTILVAVVIGACSVWSQKKAGKAGRK